MNPWYILTAVGMYMVTGSFKVADIALLPETAYPALPGVFAGFVYISPSNSENHRLTFPYHIMLIRKSCAVSPLNFPDRRWPYRSVPLV